MPQVSPKSKNRTAEAILQDFVLKEFGHFLLASDDRVFVNVLRRTLGSELGLPSNCLTIIPDEDQILKMVKEMSVKKKSVVLFIQTTFDHHRVDDLIRQIVSRFRNVRVVIVTTQSEAPHLALLREHGLVESWITKPVITAQLVSKVANIIEPHGPAEKLVQAAEEYLEQKAFRIVLTLCSKLFEVNPESAVGAMLMGDAYKGLDQEEEMIEAYERASYSDDTYLDPLKRLVEYFRDKGDKERVVHYMEKLDTLSPLNMERKVEIAQLHMELGHADEAKDFFETAMKATGKSAMDQVVHMATAIGNIYAAAGNPEAESFYRKAIEVQGDHLDKSYLHVFNRLGIHLRRVGKWKEAVTEYRKALAVDPQSESILYNMGLAFNDGEDFQNALFCMQKALTINPNLASEDAVASFNLGLVFLRARQLTEGRSFLELTLKLNPDNQTAKNWLAALDKKEKGA